MVGDIVIPPHMFISFIHDERRFLQHSTNVFSLFMMTEDWVISSHMYFLSVCWQKTVTPYAYVFYICMTTWVRVIFQHKWFISRFMIIVMHVWWLETVSFLNICAYYLCMSTWDRVIPPYMKLFLYILCFFIYAWWQETAIFFHTYFSSLLLMTSYGVIPLQMFIFYCMITGDRVIPP